MGTFAAVEGKQRFVDLPLDAALVREEDFSRYKFTEEASPEVVHSFSKKCCAKFTKRQFVRLVKVGLSKHLSIDCLASLPTGTLKFSKDELDELAEKNAPLIYSITKNYNQHLIQDLSRSGTAAKTAKALLVELAQSALDFSAGNAQGLDWRLYNALSDGRMFCKIPDAPVVTPPEVAQLEAKLAKMSQEQKGAKKNKKKEIEDQEPKEEPEPTPIKEVLFEDSDCLLGQEFLLDMARTTMKDNGKRCSDLHSYHATSSKHRDKIHFFSYMDDPFLIREITLDCYNCMSIQNQIDLLISHPRIILDKYPEIITQKMTRTHVYRFFGNIVKPLEPNAPDRLHSFEDFLKHIEKRHLKFGGQLPMDPIEEVPTDEDMFYIVQKHPIIYTVTMNRLLVNDEGKFFYQARDLRRKGLLPSLEGTSAEIEQEPSAPIKEDESEPVVNLQEIPAKEKTSIEGDNVIIEPVKESTLAKEPFQLAILILSLVIL